MRHKNIFDGASLDKKYYGLKKQKCVSGGFSDPCSAQAQNHKSASEFTNPQADLA